MDVLEDTVETDLEAAFEYIFDKDHDIEIIRRIKTRAGKINWLIQVDKKSKEHFLKIKRVCINFDRVRVVPYIQIIRCFKCQQFGHRQGSCVNSLVCPKCAEAHSERDCKSMDIKCSNCYFKETSQDCTHRADSMDCPEFHIYRQSLIGKQ